MAAETSRRRLTEKAMDQYGYVTVEDGRELGIDPVELRKLANRGWLERVSHGVYRFTDFPRTPLDPYMEAVISVGPTSFLVGDAVLAMHDLALVNPRKLRVATRRRVRLHLPETIQLVRNSAGDDELTTYEGIPTTTVARAIADCRGSVMTERLLDAVTQAEQRGLMRHEEAVRLRADLEAGQMPA
jgi:predicted transcriptional regulator of viral defense system